MSDEGSDPAAPRRILIADDAFDSRQLLARLLHQWARCAVIEVRDGLAAFERYELVRPQLTFLDIEMPKLDGMQVLERIRAVDPKAFVVLVSGQGALKNVQAALALGVSGFVVKPYRPQRIFDMLHKYRDETGDTDLLRIV